MARASRISHDGASNAQADDEIHGNETCCIGRRRTKSRRRAGLDERDRAREAEAAAAAAADALMAVIYVMGYDDRTTVNKMTK